MITDRPVTPHRYNASTFRTPGTRPARERRSPIFTNVISVPTVNEPNEASTVILA